MDKREIPWAVGYFVYEDGRVKSPSGKFLKPQKIDSRGYYRVWPNCKPVRLHRLVAELFIGNPSGHTEVNHKDGDKSNNAASNLEWSTRHQNMQHAVRTGLKPSLRGERAGNAKLTDEQVAAIRLEYRKGVKGFGCTELSKRYGCHSSNVWLIVSGKSRMAA